MIKNVWRTMVVVTVVTLSVFTANSQDENSSKRPDAVAIVDAYMAAWNAHNVVKVESFLADDIVYVDGTAEAPQKGRVAMRQNVIDVFLKAAPDLTWTRDTKTPIANADGISFEWIFKGTNSGDWDAKTPATNKVFQFKGVSFIRIKDAKIIYQGDYFDALTFQKQLGWIK